MQLEIIGAESMGVRSLCCRVTLAGRRIVIDPGVALGYVRFGLLPHPLQVAVGRRVREQVLRALEDATVDQVIDWQPDIVLAAGPPLYLDRLDKAARDCAWANALRLARHIDVVILDHHLMRSQAGAIWLDRLSASVGRRVYCAADYMGQPRRLLEAQRVELYQKMPVPEGWHDEYAKGRVNPDAYLESHI